MKYTLGIFFLVFCNYVFAADKCEEHSKIAGTMVTIKYATLETLKEKPESGILGEVWRWMGFIAGDKYKALGVDSFRTDATIKLIAMNSFSNDWRIDALIFSEYFQSVCEAGLDVLTLPPIPVKALFECFNDELRKNNFKECVREQVSEKFK